TRFSRDWSSDVCSSDLMLHAAQHIDGRVLWANLHLLFWLSLVPFTTSWVGERPAAAIPTAIYGGVFLMSGVAWLLLQRALLRRKDRKSTRLNSSHVKIS